MQRNILLTHARLRLLLLKHAHERQLAKAGRLDAREGRAVRLARKLNLHRLPRNENATRHHHAKRSTPRQHHAKGRARPAQAFDDDILLGAAHALLCERFARPEADEARSVPADQRDF